jgi:hypothetical protein
VLLNLFITWNGLQPSEGHKKHQVNSRAFKKKKALNHLLSKTLALNLSPENAICSSHPARPHTRLWDLDFYRSRTITLSRFNRFLLHCQHEILGVCGDLPTRCKKSSWTIYVLHVTLSLKAIFGIHFNFVFPTTILEDDFFLNIKGKRSETKILKRWKCLL